MKTPFEIPDKLNPTLMKYSVALDNYDPPRNTAIGIMASYDNRRGEKSFMIHMLEAIESPEKHNYAVDTGSEVVLCYVAGWSKISQYLILHRFPVNPVNPAQFCTWMLGPKKTYHLKVN